MSDLANISYSERVVEINSPQMKVGFLPLFLTLSISLSLLATIAFGGGFVVGRSQINNVANSNSTSATKIVDQKNGNSLFSDSAAKFEITFPTSWKAKSKTQGVKGAVFESDGSSVELWLEVDQPLTLSDEQKAALSSTKQIQMTINKQKADATEYAYTAGNYLTTVELAATGNNPKVTFYIKAQDSVTYEAAKKIVQSFSFQN
jgi:hypothetical protein